MNINLTNQYPAIAAVLAPVIKGWEELTNENRNAWIVEALDNLDDGRDDIEVGARHSVTGNPTVVRLTY